MKVIFLDIDGVLNSMDHLDSLMKIKPYKKKLEQFDEITHEKFGEKFDFRCCNWLEYIIGATKAKIVISSSWKEIGIVGLKEMWIKRALPGEILDITKELKSSRGQEIDNWVIENNPSSYVIIDDTADFFLHQNKNLILTNSKFGLTRELSDLAIKILGT
ncbi:MAG: HAD domain-containing protein [Bacteroidota bacterium]|nr:HAD domain-containing protein [Bacteroidota bacterium]